MRARSVPFVWLHAIAAIALLLVASTAARAQPLPDLEVSAVDVSFGLTIDSVTPVLNTPPHCIQLVLPCRPAPRPRFSGIGLVAGLARNLTSTLAIVGEVSALRTEWEEPGSAGFEVRSGRVAAFHAGPRLATDFLSGNRRDPTIGRFFGQLLMGVETSEFLPHRLSLLGGGGADFAIPAATRGAPGSRPVLLRGSFDYRFSPGERRSFSGYRFTIQVLYGPRLK